MILPDIEKESSSHSNLFIQKIEWRDDFEPILGEKVLSGNNIPFHFVLYCTLATPLQRLQISLQNCNVHHAPSQFHFKLPTDLQRQPKVVAKL